MLHDLQALEQAVRDFQRQADFDFIDPSRLSKVIDSLQGTLCTVLHMAKKRHEHQLNNQSACSWAARQCQMSKTAAADRLCVGEQLESMPLVAQALSSGEIGFQAAATICHLQARVGEIGKGIGKGVVARAARRARRIQTRELAVARVGAHELQVAVEDGERQRHRLEEQVETCVLGRHALISYFEISAGRSVG